MNRTRWIVTGVTATALIGLLGHAGGCHTVEGLGQDMQAGGRHLSDAARRHNVYAEPRVDRRPDENPYR